MVRITSRIEARFPVAAGIVGGAATFGAVGTFVGDDPHGGRSIGCTVVTLGGNDCGVRLRGFHTWLERVSGTCGH